MSQLDDLIGLARTLYATPLGSFVTHRNAAAKELQRSGDRALAAQVKALPKPSAAAWAINLLARTSPDDLSQLIAVNSALQQAQTSNDSGQLHDMAVQRRRVSGAVSGQVLRLAAEYGQVLSPAADEQVRSTITAAIIDLDAAAAMETALLIRHLNASGLGGVDLTGAVAVPAAIKPRAQPKLLAVPPATPPDDLQADDEALKEAARKQAALELAQAAAQQAKLQLDSARRRSDRAVASVADARELVDERTRQLAKTRKKLKAARRDAQTAAESLADAEQTSQAAVAYAESLAGSLNAATFQRNETPRNR